MGIISGSGSFRGQFGDHFRVGDHFGVGIISGAVQGSSVDCVNQVIISSFVLVAAIIVICPFVSHP